MTPTPKKRPKGIDLLRDERLNKGTAFSEEERDALKLRGLLPPHINTLEEQEERVLWNLQHKPTPLEKYIFMIGLQDRNETLFYRTVIDHVYDLISKHSSIDVETLRRQKQRLHPQSSALAESAALTPEEAAAAPLGDDLPADGASEEARETAGGRNPPWSRTGPGADRSVDCGSVGDRR